nr:polysaccharide biosynthesis C-terminal domain-containing protein [Methylobacterium sp. BTF04]
MATQYFRAMQDTNIVFRAFVVSLLVSLAIMYPLVARYGVTGTALVIAIGHGTSAAFLLFAAMRRVTIGEKPIPRP